MPSSQTDREPLSGRGLRERALDLLSRRDHSVQELGRKLQEKGALAEELPPLLDELQRRGYLDDRRFAENFVRYRKGKAWGRMRYRQELMRRGVPQAIIDDALSTLPELSSEAMAGKLEELVARELRKGRSEEKVVASLLRRGFSITLIRQAFGRLEEI